ncbi:gliding motility-associated C-terminal domain-containing protein [uncultured Draconibacterium sp.]|uniref:T9SS type B sorting domain-containing protein n=1 Tax=uncultured Draconibacterium sp. TaxID=1573823 RepID=UPI0025D9F3C8|nr:gliding motility-associated C-terminal domain-containing protein [uncultured Draconibacterium sp.]
MILTLLAALYGAAQEDFVVFEGAEQNYFVENHSGSDYSWRVLTSFNPDTEAAANNYTFVGSSNSNEITVRWKSAGLYYLDVIETDISGCTNRKVVVVTVLSTTRSVAFANRSSAICFNPHPDESRLLQLLDNEGAELDPSKFPVEVKVDINGSEFTFQINNDDRGISVPDSFMLTAPEEDVQVAITLLEATDAKGQSIKPLTGSDVHRITVFAQPEIEFVTAADTIKYVGDGFYEVEMTRGTTEGAVYNWKVEPSDGTSTDLQALTGPSANIFWDGPEGIYTLSATVTDGNGCLADTIETLVELIASDEEGEGDTTVVEPPILFIYAGTDTTVGACEPYTFSEVFPTADTFSYQWEPSQYLSDPTIANPVFTPEETSTYVLTVSSQSGLTATDTVTISVANLVANAGEDIMLDQETSALLNGLGSVGEQIEFNWTTENGSFIGGQNTATPEIGSAGTYYLQVTDIFGCTATDSVVVSRFISAPIARDDYDTTEYQQSVTIDLLANDEDPQQELDPLSLQILQNPENGFVDINGDGTITYTPNDGFLGGDVFQYRICNYYEKCDNANVFVYVMAADFFIPEAFTPNGDNVNDYFEIKGIELFEQNSITIINRWGKTVYKARGYGLSTSPKFWDGKSNQLGGDSDLPTGTYFYVLDLGNGEQPIAGSVYIDR